MCGRTVRCRRFERGDGDGEYVRDGGIVGVDAGAGQTSGARAYECDATSPGGPSVPLRRVMEDVGEPRLKEELPCGEALDEAHGAATAWARPR